MLDLFSIIDAYTAYGWNIDRSNATVLFRPEPGPLAPRKFPEALPE